jgi:hypothetical protein
MNIDATQVSELDLVLNDLLQIKDVSYEEMLKASIELMKAAEKYKNLSGIEKKNLVLYVLDKYIKDNNPELSSFMQIIHPLIDIIILLDKKEIRIQLSKCFGSCFKKCT